MNLPQDNYSIILIDHSQMTNEEYQKLVSMNSIVRVLPFPNEQAELYLDVADDINNSFQRNENKKNEQPKPYYEDDLVIIH